MSAQWLEEWHQRKLKNEVMAQTIGQSPYAGFWHRLAAGIIDFLILCTAVFAFEWTKGQSRFIFIMLTMPAIFFYSAYSIYFHGKFGQTLGKMALKIQVRGVEGEQISWRQAFVRSSPGLAFDLAVGVGLILTVQQFSDLEFHSLSWLKRGGALVAAQHEVFNWLQTASQVWFWSEVVTMLFNSRRRALHDFLAGTVVVRMNAISRPASQLTFEDESTDNVADENSDESGVTERELCPDGGCTGILGEDGRCGTCGKAMH